jgi:hypothetical protein
MVICTLASLSQVPQPRMLRHMPQGGDVKSLTTLPLPTSTPALSTDVRRHDALLGGLFVVLWSTGYPAARIGLNHSAPFTLLVLRFGGAAVIFAAIAWITRASWPRGRAMLPSAVVGSLQLALQFGAL